MSNNSSRLDNDTLNPAVATESPDNLFLCDSLDEEDQNSSRGDNERPDQRLRKKKRKSSNIFPENQTENNHQKTLKTTHRSNSIPSIMSGRPGKSNLVVETNFFGKRKSVSFRDEQDLDVISSPISDITNAIDIFRTPSAWEDYYQCDRKEEIKPNNVLEVVDLTRSPSSADLDVTIDANSKNVESSAIVPTTNSPGKVGIDIYRASDDPYTPVPDTPMEISVSSQSLLPSDNSASNSDNVKESLAEDSVFGNNDGDIDSDSGDINSGENESTIIHEESELDSKANNPNTISTTEDSSQTVQGKTSIEELNSSSQTQDFNSISQTQDLNSSLPIPGETPKSHSSPFDTTEIVALAVTGIVVFFFMLLFTLHVRRKIKHKNSLASSISTSSIPSNSLNEDWSQPSPSPDDDDGDVEYHDDKLSPLPSNLFHSPMIIKEGRSRRFNILSLDNNSPLEDLKI